MHRATSELTAPTLMGQAAQRAVLCILQKCNLFVSLSYLLQEAGSTSLSGGKDTRPLLGKSTSVSRVSPQSEAAVHVTLTSHARLEKN